MSAASANAAAVASAGGGGATGNGSASGLTFRGVLQRLGRDQGVEYEQTLTFNPAATVSTPTALRTDRKIKAVVIDWRGRITVGGSAVTFSAGSPLYSSPLWRLINQVTVRGVHLVQGAQSPFLVLGEDQEEMNYIFGINYTPLWTNSLNSGAVTRSAALNGTAAETNDVEFVFILPLFPISSNQLDIAENCINGPDWPGNLYLDIVCGDGTALGVTAASVSFQAYQSATGSPTMDIYTVRPMLGVPLMNSITSAIPFRVRIGTQPSSAIITGGTGIDLADLFVGQKDTSRLIIKTGVLQTSPALTSGLVAYASLSDAELDATVFSLDGRNLRFNRHDLPAQAYSSWALDRQLPVGFRIIDYVETPGSGTPNLHGRFRSSLLTAARKYQINSNATATANALASVYQEMLLGSGQIVGLSGKNAEAAPGTGAVTATSG
jgi:hypothetical protein